MVRIVSRPARAAVAKSLLRSLVCIGLLAATAAAVSTVSQVLASLWLMSGSCWFLARPYRKEWPLLPSTCLLPAGALLVGYGVQVGNTGSAGPGSVMAIAAMAGGVCGLLRGWRSRVLVKNGRPFAGRISGYVWLWALCLVSTQAIGLAGLPKGVGIGLVGGAFTTALFVGISLAMLLRYVVRRGKAGRATAATSSISVLVGATALLVSVGSVGAWSLGSDQGDYWFSSTVFRSRLPSDAEINAAGRGFIGNWQPPDLGPASDRERVISFRVLQATVQKYHKRDYRNHVHASYALLFFDAEVKGEYRTGMPGGPTEVRRGMSYSVAWLRQTPSGSFTFGKDKYAYFPTAEKRLEAMRGWQRAFGLLPDFAAPLGHAGQDTGGTAGRSRRQGYVAGVAQNIQDGLSSAHGSDAAVTVGLAAGTAMLLAGAGVAAATAAAQAAAAAGAATAPPLGDPTLSGDGRIAGGQEAMDWLHAHGYVTKDGRPTPQFYSWRDQAWSDQKPGPGGLVGVAGQGWSNWDKTPNQPLKDIHIVVQGDPTKAPPVTPDPPPVEPKTKAPGTTKPETKRPETKKPETKKPETKRPETKKPETKRPVTKKPVTMVPITRPPSTRPPRTRSPDDLLETNYFKIKWVGGIDATYMGTFIVKIQELYIGKNPVKGDRFRRGRSRLLQFKGIGLGVGLKAGMMGPSGWKKFRTPYPCRVEDFVGAGKISFGPSLSVGIDVMDRTIGSVPPRLYFLGTGVEVSMDQPSTGLVAGLGGCYWGTWGIVGLGAESRPLYRFLWKWKS